jgi:hypothetical protein
VETPGEMMTWYAAHLIMYFKRKRGPQERFLVWENVVLIKAASADEAYEKAERRGREEEASTSDATTIGGHPSRMIFAGVRKITTCEDENSRPNDGIEITYNEFGVRSEAAIRELVDGKSVKVELLDPFPEDEDVAPATSKNGAQQSKKFAPRTDYSGTYTQERFS